jgi:hypothetical protein
VKDGRPPGPVIPNTLVLVRRFDQYLAANQFTPATRRSYRSAIYRCLEETCLAPSQANGTGPGYPETSKVTEPGLLWKTAYPPFSEGTLIPPMTNTS